MKPKLPQLPFLTREMLKFGRTAKFDLSLDIWASQGETVFITGMTRNRPFSFKITAPADNLRDNHTFGLDDIPLFLNIYTSSGSVHRGEIYVNLQLLISSTVVYSFISGYITSRVGLNWPYGENEHSRSGIGHFRGFSSANPAAAAEMSQTVDSGQTWRIHTLTITLVTDANAADRLVKLKITNPAINVFQIPASVKQTASTTRTYLFGIGLENLNETESGIITAPLPPDLWFNSGSTISTVTANKQAGDDFGAAIFRVEQLIEATN